MRVHRYTDANHPGRNSARSDHRHDRGGIRSSTQFESWGNVVLRRTIRRWDVAVAFVLIAVAVISATVSGKLALLAVGAAMVASVLAGLRIILERMLDRIANDSYDSGKAAERRAIVRDLAEYVEQRGRSKSAG